MYASPRRLATWTLGFAACLAVSCVGTIRGTNFGSEGDPYLRNEPTALPNRDDEPVFRLILIGDAGSPAPEDDPVLSLVEPWSADQPEQTRVVYLGDNLYPAGLQDDYRERGERILTQQIEAGRAPKIFVPGNHDWGYTIVQQLTPGVLENQQAFIESHPEALFAPRDGCPGPEVIELLAPEDLLHGGLALIALDLHWWLLPEEQRPVCEGITDTSEFLDRLGAALAEHADRNLVVVAHHPLRSGGTHGGFSRGWFTDLGAALARRFYSLQDFIEPSYEEMVGVISAVMAENPPLAMAAGHDHSLQILDGDDIARLLIVSGAGSFADRVAAIEGTLFAHAHLGFVVMDFYSLEAGVEEVLIVSVVEPGRGDDPVFSLALDLAEETTEPEPVPQPVPGP